MTGWGGPGQLTVRGLWQTARLLLGTDDTDSREIRAGVLLLAAVTVCGPNLRRLREFTRIPWRDITHVSYYLRQAGIWRQDVVEARWLEEDCDPELSVVAFVLQVLVATGEVTRPDGERYATRTVGHVFGAECDIPWRAVVPARPLRATGAEPAWLGP